MTCRLRWCVEMETRCRIPIWRTFGKIQWHVIPEPCITLQGAATWWIHCHDSTATSHIAWCKNSIRLIENRYSPYFNFFLFLMQFRLWRAAAFVSSPIHVFSRCLRVCMCVCVNEPKRCSGDMSCSVDHHVSGCWYFSRCSHVSINQWFIEYCSMKCWIKQAR